MSRGERAWRFYLSFIQGVVTPWRENHAFQPAELVKDLDLPLFLLYGDADWITPPLENAEKLKSLFPSSERVAG